MLKEFNLDNYKYVEEKISYGVFLSQYLPLNNHLKQDARLDGILYEHEGEQWQHIMQLSSANIWTLFEEDGQLRIRNGYQVRGRIGYIHCKNMHNAHTTIMVDGLTQEMLDHRPGSEEL